MARIAHLALATPNVVKTANFYQEVFRLHESDRSYEPGARGNPPDEKVSTLFLSDGYMDLAICRRGRAVGVYHFGFVVDDMAETLDRLKAAGGSLMKASGGVNVVAQEAEGGSKVKWRGPEGVQIDLSTRGWVGVQTAEGVRDKIQHIALGTPDVAKTANFYKEGFGLVEVRRRYERGAGDNPPDEMLRRIFLSDGYMDLAICNVRATGMYHFGFMVDDMDETLDRLKAAGGSLIRAPRPGDVLVQGAEEQRHYRALAKWRGPEGVQIDLSTRS